MKTVDILAAAFAVLLVASTCAYQLWRFLKGKKGGCGSGCEGCSGCGARCRAPHCGEKTCRCEKETR